MALGEACSIVLRGATQQILDEAERSLHDALCVMSQTVKETRTVFGGGQLHRLACSTYSAVPPRPRKYSSSKAANVAPQKSPKSPGM